MVNEKRIREVFRNIPELETERLILGKITLSDAFDMYDYSRREEITRYLTWSPHASLAQTERYIRLLEKKYASGTFWDFGIRNKESGKFIGTCGFTSFCTDEDRAEIGYVLAPEFWGRGLAVEACRAVLKFGFAVFDFSSFCARFIEGNAASERVMQKLGMSFAATYKNSFFIKNEYRTVTEYKMTKREFFEKEAEITRMCS